MRYFFLHPKTGTVYHIYNGRSLWEDNLHKAEFIVVKEIGPAMDHADEACDASLIDTRVMMDIQLTLESKKYPPAIVETILKKLQE